MEEKWVKLIEGLYSKQMSLAAMTSILIMKGCKVGKYMEIRKFVEKELQRIATRRKQVEKSMKTVKGK